MNPLNAEYQQELPIPQEVDTELALKLQEFEWTIV
jgi:hypothetical protein